MGQNEHVSVSVGDLAALGDTPGQLAGYGEISAQHALELAARKDATWRRIPTDPRSGQVLVVGAHPLPASGRV